MRFRATLAALSGAALLLGGCVSFGEDPPASLLTLTSDAAAPAGAAARGTNKVALAVLDIGAPQRLDVNRVPVQMTSSKLAYLKDAVWVEKPASLFARMLAETIRAKGNRLVVEGAQLQYGAATQLSGQLVDMGYDVGSQSAVVTFDATLQTADGEILTRRFQAERGGIAAEADAVGPALNDAANEVADQVAEWVG
ncbi:ABC transporter [Altererythrobacter endophyticus]|uniref:ABC transporter n=2 Tax=Altericroceibacterium endophyticum TaxID=1808508 RepID=A0A6I4T9I4_9SPHN|nr:ABC transporter [Altericroceibacterium endophyticum]